MVTPTIDNQGNTYRCGAYSIRQWFEGAGYNAAATQAFAKYVGLADQQQGLSFQQVHDFVTELAAELNVVVQWLGDGYLKDFPTFDQAVKDKWCVDVGVWEADIKPGQNYYHYIDVSGLNGSNFTIADSFHLYDGEQGQEPVEKVHQAIIDNWDTVLVGIAFKFAQPATAQSVNDQIVTILSVLGQATYPDTAQWDEAMPNETVSRRIFQRQLVQNAKALLGA